MRLWILPASLIFLTITSVVILFSLAPELASRQLLFILVGLGLFFGVSQIKPKMLMSNSRKLYFLSCLLLILVLVVGSLTRNTARWIDLGLFNFQPSQLAIPLVGLYIATLASQLNMRRFRDLTKILAILLIPVALVLVEPDLGTSLLMFMSVFVIIFVAGVQLKHLAILLIFGLCVAIFAWQLVLRPYQKERILSFVSPDAAESSSTYNSRQAIIAVGSGGIIGQGLGRGSQSQLKFLPEKHTDFIFASISEETGIVGSNLIIGIYLLIISFLLVESRKLSNFPHQLFLIFLATLVGLEMVINIGANLGLLPITGLTLPLVSYGGSSLLSLFFAFGIAQSLLKGKQTSPRLHLS